MLVIRASVKSVFARLNLALDGVSLSNLKLKSTAPDVFVESLGRRDGNSVGNRGVGHGLSPHIDAKGRIPYRRCSGYKEC